MLPISLTLTNFKSHSDTTLDFTQGVHAISGANGAGKSTILEGLVYALYGPDGLGLATRSDTVVREGTEACRVQLVFEIGGTRYRVVRERSLKGAGKSTVELARATVVADDPEATVDGWSSLTKGTLRETQERIVEILGASASTFLRTVHVGQGEATAFARATPGERKETLSQALDLGQYPPLAEGARKRAGTERAAIASAQQRITDLEQQLDGVNLPELEELAMLLEVDITTAAGARPALLTVVDTARKEVEDARVAAASGDAARQRVADLTTHTAQVQARVTAATSTLATRQAAAATNRAAADGLATLQAQQPTLVELAPLEEAAAASRATVTTAGTTLQRAEHGHTLLRNAKDELARLEQQRKTIEASREAVRVQIRALDETTDEAHCPTCAQTLGIDAREKTKTTLRAQLESGEQQWQDAVRAEGLKRSLVIDLGPNAVELEPLQQAVATAMEDRTAKEAALAGATASNQRHHAMAAQMATAKAAADQQPALDAAVTEAQQELNAAEESHAVAVADLAAARKNIEGDDAAARIVQLTAAVTVAEQAVKDHDAIVEQKQQDLARMRARVEQLTKVQQQLDDARALVAPAEAVAARWDILSRAFGRDGIPQQVTRNARPQIEADTNQILEDVGAPYRVRIDLETETKSGEMRDALDITIIAGGMERPFDLLSGGEKYRVAIALRVALSRVLAHRSGNRMEMLVLDEPEGLDVAGFAALAELIRQLGSEFRFVAAVTHSDALDTVCDTRMLVEKVDGASRVTIAA